jgi:membrane-associated phospholipid phosphatase
MNRLYRDRHWTTDIVAGLSAGAAIATALNTIEK